MLRESFLCAGCSSFPSNLAAHRQRYLLYASGKNVLVTDTDAAARRTIALPCLDADVERENNQAAVHALQWLEHARGWLGVASATASGLVCIYKCADPDVVMDAAAWILLKSVKLGAAVSRLSVVRLVSGDLFFVAATIDGALHSWTEQDAASEASLQSTPVMTHAFGQKKVTSVKALLLAGQPLVLAALSDCAIECLLPLEGRVVLRLTGHQNWVTSMDALADGAQPDTFLIASASLDKTVRVWKLRPLLETNEPTAPVVADLCPQRSGFSLGSAGAYQLDLDAVIVGHENTVTCCGFLPDASGALGNARLLTGSSDRSVIVWQQGSVGTDAWCSCVRLGESTTAAMASIGLEHSLAFYGAVELDHGRVIAAAMSTGSVIFWKKTSDVGMAQYDLNAMPPITGHIGPVVACLWNPCHGAQSLYKSANFLLSLSRDQTARVFARLHAHGYHEIARPQVHGYDLACAALYPTPDGNVEMLSGADEKVVRVFAAPSVFARMFEPTDERIGRLPPPAALPALGLSNKILDPKELEAQAGANDTTCAPFTSESKLSRGSLWPEVDKLYAHNQELVAVAVDAAGRWAASAAKSHLAADAAIHFWHKAADQWTPFGDPLSVHSLTVTKVSFAPNRADLVLAVSRDRQWSLLQLNSGQSSFACLQKQPDAHSRIIWASAWLPSVPAFVTGSRDKTVKTWLQSAPDSPFAQAHLLEFAYGVTAIAIGPNEIMAVGDEHGGIALYKFRAGPSVTWECTMDRRQVCAGPIADLQFDGTGKLLAVASHDRTLRVFNYE